ncbi:putative Transmembrane protease serine 9 [Hypsibius exemplaris]|uniref:Transmembrane protease serine 9 n=1 Tax=Hypsibius exemplaris TaxID=2072580 RepID=A0A1W0WII7_HYPEX|nr:putative Transmembrane protease serine 9 [Hypsibius exemplaris]
MFWIMPLLLFTCVFKTGAAFEECERTASQIINGVNATKHQLNWIVSIQYPNAYDVLKHICGGSIISNRLILTAAHCLFYPNSNDLLDKDQLKVKGGSHNPHNSLAVSISNIQIHPGYNNYNPGTHLQHDIALLTLAKAIKIGNEKVDYISLPPPGKKLCTEDEDMAWIAGWGYTKRNYSEADLTRVTPPVILQLARVELISRRACQSIYPKFNFTEHIICTDSTNTDVCQGDSGGALFEEYLVLNRTTGLTTKKHRILGIVSGSSKGCGIPGKASILTNDAWEIIEGQEESDEPEQEDAETLESLFAQLEPTLFNRTLLKRPDSAIFGRPTALPLEFPFMVSLRKDGSHFCGGVLLSAQHVLTKHIVFLMRRAGINCKQTRSQSAFMNPHANYRGWSTIYEHDIAMLTLREQIPRSMSGTLAIRIVLPSSKRINPRPGSILLAAGWGQTKSGARGYGKAAEQLQAANMTVISLSVCRQRLEDAHMPITKMCVDSNVTATCQGDGGGPLFKKLPSGSYELVGITSYGVQKCSQAGKASVFTRISQYLNWIHSTMQRTSRPTSRSPRTRQEH